MKSLRSARKMSLLLLAVVVTLHIGQCDAELPRGYSQRLANPPEEVLMLPKKRPFCNAFTGCGRKRSASPGMPLPELVRQRQIAEDDNLSSLLDLSAEPAVEDLSRQIMSEAKLWEAIQEASAEIYRRKQMGNNNYPVAFNWQKK